MEQSAFWSLVVLFFFGELFYVFLSYPKSVASAYLFVTNIISLKVLSCFFVSSTLRSKINHRFLFLSWNISHGPKKFLLLYCLAKWSASCTKHRGTLWYSWTGSFVINSIYPLLLMLLHRYVSFDILLSMEYGWSIRRYHGIT